MVLPQWRAILVAKQAAEVDILSGGQSGPGVSVGGEKHNLLFTVLRAQSDPASVEVSVSLDWYI